MKYKSKLVIIAAFASILFSCADKSRKSSGLNYKILDQGREYAIVHLSGDARPEQMDIVADSLYEVTQHNKLDSYHVMFYYREDYKGHVCYADKLWFWNKNMQIEKGKLDVTGIKSVDP